MGTYNTISVSSSKICSQNNHPLTPGLVHPKKSCTILFISTDFKKWSLEKVLSMHLQLKTVQGSPIALGRFLAAIMDLLPFPITIPTTTSTTIPIQEAIQSLFLERIPPSLEYPKPKSEELINLAIEKNITRANKLSLQGGDGPFFVADLGQVTRQHQRWMRSLPTIQPYYGVYHKRFLISNIRNSNSDQVQSVRLFPVKY